MQKINVGAWRDDAKGPMQVVSGPMVSGPIGKQKVHYEAPPANRMPKEIKAFLRWFKKPDDADPLLFAGLAHL